MNRIELIDSVNELVDMKLITTIGGANIIKKFDKLRKDDGDKR